MPYSIAKAEGVIRVSEIRYGKGTESILVTPSPIVVNNEIYSQLIGKDSDTKTSPQRFFNEQVELGKIKVREIDGDNTFTNQYELIASMSTKDAKAFVSKVFDRKVLEQIIDNDSRKSVKAAAKASLREVNPVKAEAI